MVINRTLHYFSIRNKITPSVFLITHYKVVFTLFAFLLNLCELHPPSKLYLMGFPGDSGSVTGSGRSSGGGNGYPLSILAWRIPWT